MGRLANRPVAKDVSIVQINAAIAECACPRCGAAAHEPCTMKSSMFPGKKVYAQQPHTARICAAHELLIKQSAKQ